VCTATMACLAPLLGSPPPMYCPHAMVDLSKGKVVDGELICPGHGWGFKLNGGTCDRHNSKIRCEEIYENN
jgi:hypothetical protein